LNPEEGKMDRDAKDPLADEQRARGEWRGDDESSGAPESPGHTQPASESEGDGMPSGGGHGAVPAPRVTPPD
jgi:hypothetical protein